MTTPAEQASERNAEDDIALSRLWPFARAAVPYWIARAERAEARLAECERERDRLAQEITRLRGENAILRQTRHHASDLDRLGKEFTAQQGKDNA
jgi:cell division protein FtsB